MILQDTPIALATPSQRLAHAAANERRRKFFHPPPAPEPVISPPVVVCDPIAEIRAEIARSPVIEREVVVGTQQVLKSEPVCERKRYPAIATIQKTVCRFYKVSMDDLRSSRRTGNLIRPRHIAMYLARELTLNSFPEIGRRFGDRDHTTCLHAAKKIKAARLTDPTLDEQLCQFAALLQPQEVEASNAPVG